MITENKKLGLIFLKKIFSTGGSVLTIVRHSSGSHQAVIKLLFAYFLSPDYTFFDIIKELGWVRSHTGLKIDLKVSLVLAKK